MPDSQPKPKKNGPDPERLKVEGDPEQQFRKLLQPVPEKPEKPRKEGK